MGTGGSFCPTGEPTETDLLSYISSCFLYNVNFGKLVALLATCFHAGFVLGLFFDPEDGSVDFQRTTWRCVPEDGNYRAYIILENVR
jgi:hypothetical protein